MMLKQADRCRRRALRLQLVPIVAIAQESANYMKLVHSPYVSSMGNMPPIAVVLANAAENAVSCWRNFDSMPNRCELEAIGPIGTVQSLGVC